MSLTVRFETYLKETLGVSGKTLRNYRADLGHFLRWSDCEDLETLLPHFSESLVTSYREHHGKAGTPQSTTNRRLSTLRNFGKFLSVSGLANHNPAESVSNIKHEPSQEEKIQALVGAFAKHLDEEGVTKTTRKNYLSDVRHFVAWLSKQEDWTKEQEVQSS